MVSRTMTEVALRLAEPENIAKESVVTVSQAIRREVAAMGDGIERALARASELEVLVHNEVASLERSYTDNELRVRRLIDELVTEREAIVQNAERVRQAIRGSHDSFSADLAGITDQIAVAADSCREAHLRPPRRPQPGDHADARRHRRAGRQSAGDAQRQSLPPHQRGRRQALRHDHQSRRPAGRAAEQCRRQRLRDVPGEQRRPRRSPEPHDRQPLRQLLRARRDAARAHHRDERELHRFAARARRRSPDAARNLERPHARRLLAARRRPDRRDQPGGRRALAQRRGERPRSHAADARGGRRLRRRDGGADQGDRRPPAPGAGPPRHDADRSRRRR